MFVRPHVCYGDIHKYGVHTFVCSGCLVWESLGIRRIDLSLHCVCRLQRLVTQTLASHRLVNTRACNVVGALHESMVSTNMRPPYTVATIPTGVSSVARVVARPLVLSATSQNTRVYANTDALCVYENLHGT